MLDIDWNQPRTGCKTCSHPNYHICLQDKPDLFPKLLREELVGYRRPGRVRGVRNKSERSDAHRLAISEAQQFRWAQVREANRPRDEAIISQYAAGGVSIKDLSDKFKIGRNAVMIILKRAAAEGIIVMRLPGTTISNGAK